MMNVPGRRKELPNSRIPWFAIMLLALGACQADTAAPVRVHKVEIVSGANQTAGQGSTLDNPVTVRVLEDGAPAANRDVFWRVIEGGGTVDEAVTQTDAQGLTSVVWRLGEGAGQQLLNASSGNGSITIRAEAIFEVTDVSVGYRHACFLSSQGEAFCWGDNSTFQLGDGTTTSRTTPVRVATGVRFRKLTAGFSHTCGISTSGAAFCWGDNVAGQLGLPLTTTRSGTPVAVPVEGGLIDISAGFVHTCAVVATPGRVARCWGSDQLGQLGGTASVGRLQNITAGEFHTCGTRDDHIGVCWGSNRNGQTGTNRALGEIVAPSGLWFGTFTSIAAGLRHTCGVHTNTQVWCWGGNGAGENGQPPGTQILVPVAVAGTQNFTAVTAGNVHSCGISNGRVFCWGQGHGPTPAQISATLTFTKIDAGLDRTCGIADRALWCWNAGSLVLEKIATP